MIEKLTKKKIIATRANSTMFCPEVVRRPALQLALLRIALPARRMCRKAFLTDQNLIPYRRRSPCNYSGRQFEHATRSAMKSRDPVGR